MASPFAERRSLDDPRRSVFERHLDITAEELKAPLLKPAPPRRWPFANRQASDLFGLLCCTNCLPEAFAKLCSAPQVKRQDTPTPTAPRRWYRIHPITNTLYFCRPDAGLRGRIPGYEELDLLSEVPLPGDSIQLDEPEKGRSRCDTHNVFHVPEAEMSIRSHTKRRRPSLPPEVERRLGLPPEMLTSMLDSSCIICYNRPRAVILLPCRHGGFCEECLRRHLFIKPAHRGGRACPLCRRPIREVVRMYEDAVFPQYGYAIKADTCLRQ